MLKHADFVIIDLLCLQLSFLLTFWILNGFGNPYDIGAYKNLGMTLLIGQLLTITFSNNYSQIIRRGRSDELNSVLQFAVIMLVASLVMLFVFKYTGTISRMQMGGTIVLYIIIDYLLRQLRKKWLYRKSANGERRMGHSLILITTGINVDDAMKRLVEKDIMLKEIQKTYDGGKNTDIGKISNPCLYRILTLYISLAAIFSSYVFLRVCSQKKRRAGNKCE